MTTISTEKDHVVVACVDGNYRLNDELRTRVREAIFGPDYYFGRSDDLYMRSMDAIWRHMWDLNFNGIPTQDNKGWTRPDTDILIDLQLIAMNSSTRNTLKLLELVFGDDAFEMLKRFRECNIVIANHTGSKKHVHRLMAMIHGKPPLVEHPDTIAAKAAKRAKRAA